MGQYKFDQALEESKPLLGYLKELNLTDSKEMFETCNNLGAINLHAKNYQEAHNLFWMAIKIAHPRFLARIVWRQVLCIKISPSSMETGLTKSLCCIKRSLECPTLRPPQNKRLLCENIKYGRVSMKDNGPPPESMKTPGTGAPTAPSAGPTQSPLNLVTPVIVHEKWEDTYNQKDVQESGNVDYKELADGSIVISKQSLELIQRKLNAASELKKTALENPENP